MNEAFGKALRDLARPTTPEELAKRGVQRVRSVSVQQVSRMIEIAIDQTLVEHKAEFSTEERAELLKGAEGRFKNLLTAQRRLADVAATQRENEEEAVASPAPGSQGNEDLEAITQLFDSATDSTQVQEVREQVERALQRSREREELLERRIAKLSRTAAESEAALSSALECFDSASPYRSHAPRGVESADPRRDQKLSMMRGVLDKNLGLRRE